MVERRKGVTWNERLLFKKSLVAERDDIPANNNSSILLDYTEKLGALIYTCTQNRAQAASRVDELENIVDYYVGWNINYCGQVREVIAYSPSIDGDGVVIGRFTLNTAFISEPATGANMFLLNPDQITEVDQQILISDSGNQVDLGGENNVGVIHNSPRSGDFTEDGFIEYEIFDENNQAYLLGFKPTKTDSINVSTFCTVLGVTAAGRDAFLTKIGFFLDSVPSGTKARVVLMGRDKLNTRYPLVENVTVDEFNRGEGDPVSVSVYADETTWNLIEMSNPTVARIELQFDLIVFFSDEDGNPRNIDVPVDTSLTPFFISVREDNIQSAVGASITLDTNASPRDDDYNGMRLYIGGNFKEIIDYDGATKVATVDSPYSVTPSPGDPYQIKIPFISPMVTYVYKTTIKGQVQNASNYRELSYSNNGEYIRSGTINRVDTTGGSPTLILTTQSLEYKGTWVDIIDSENNFDTNSVTIRANDFDAFEGNFYPDNFFVCNEKGARYRFRYTDDDDYGWTVEKYQASTYGEMYQFDQLHTITISASNTWYDIDNMNAGEIKNFIFQNTKELVCQIPGKYDANYHTCAIDGANTGFKWGLAVNNVPVGKSQTCSRMSNATDVLSPSGGTILDLSVGDIVTVQVLNSTNTQDIDIIDANVNLVLIRDL